MPRLTLLACLLACTLGSPQLLAKGPAYLDPQQAGVDYQLQGEYLGDVTTPDGEVQVGLQVIALGKGRFRCQALIGGLPGAGWNREQPLTAEAERREETLTFESGPWRAVIRDGEATVQDTGRDVGKLKRVARVSPTLGQPAPEGAVVLFDGRSVDAWKDGKMSEEGWLMQGTTSRETFGDCSLHLEFLLPFQPEDSGQARGNSGVYLQGRYEVQMLDSFGLAGKQNECGGLYSVRDPDLNMCLPPLQWQTYDIDFTAARYDGDKLVASPRITVRHNGVVIHNQVELPGDRGTTAAPVPPGPEPGPIYLQNHGNPVRYRNIWVVKK